jgi:hypothetical protein
MNDELIHNISPIRLHCAAKFNSVNKWKFNSDWQLYSVYTNKPAPQYEAAKCKGSETSLDATYVKHNILWKPNHGGAMPLLRFI